ncbi:EAL domain-containing protein [Shewanella sp. WXL01]|uniref:sensor domain-containing protein n=1 Tax=Shewanella sp. WXL01 TaxID=2709721 RepID=UPI0014384EBD|nr:GGDEF and EAL domain-containing protein [Shewanella sp. WXL01]NKF52486.1 EAL domain-containing protein [Shewanella sp. WXL01]
MIIEPQQIALWQPVVDKIYERFGVVCVLSRYCVFQSQATPLTELPAKYFEDPLQLTIHSNHIKSYCEAAIESQPNHDLAELDFQLLVMPSMQIFGGISWQPTLVLTEEQRVEFNQELTSFIEGIKQYIVQQYNEFIADETSARVQLEDIDPISVQSFIDAHEEHVWVKDSNGVYLACNRSVEKAWNMSNSDIVGKTDEQLFDTRTAQMFHETDQKAILRGVRTSVSECESFDAFRNKVWLETYKAPLRDKQGQTIGVIGVSRNIAKHKEAEEQLLLAASVFRNAVEGVVITDHLGNITDTNESFTRITGYNKDEVLGQNPRILRSGRHDEQFYKKMWNTLIVQGKWHGEIWNRRKNGSIFPQAITISAVYGDNNEIRYFVAVFADISDQKQTEEKLKNLAYFDPLTQLPNRMQFLSSLEQELNHARRNQTKLAVIFIDVDFFKNINDSLGHIIGDEIIIELGRRFTYTLAQDDVLARLGGDEFVVMLPNVSGTDYVSSTINRLRSVFEKPFLVAQSEPVRLSASMGVSIYPNDADDHDSLLLNADSAMHRAKSDGRNNFAFYNESMTKASVEQLKLQNALHQALVEFQFELHYQPKICLKQTGSLGLEALIRWHHPQLGQVSPADFIPLAEEIGLIWDIGLWVLNEACTQGVRWLNSGFSFDRISVNVASLQLQRADFVDEVMKVLLNTGLPAKHLELEITESCMMNHPEEIINVLKTLGNMGIAISIDDFGTGYSSLNYLKKLPIDILKIDQSFMRDIPDDSNNAAIAKAIIAMGHAMNLKVIAEGVETKQQAEFLIANGCDYAQGYLYSKPKSADDITHDSSIGVRGC